MSKFNETNTNKTVNHCGHVAYSMKDKEKLVTQVLTTFFGEDKFYGNNDSELVQTAERVLDNEPKFVANLARYARKEIHLRSVSHVLSVLVAHNMKSKPYIKEVISDVVERPDDITEILACYITMFGKPIPNGLKKALGNAMGKFTAYQLSKYNGGNKSVKFRDVLRITHPTPKDKEQEQLYKMVLDDTLPIAERWETELSANGNNKETWEKLIAENKLGYMAMIRNLRNILKAQPENIGKVYAKLANKEQVLRSKQLPFRFFSAYVEVKDLPECTSKVLDTLETAIEYSLENLPKLEGKTVIAIDNSGSMSCRISEKSDVRCADIAKLLGVIASHLCEESTVLWFSDRIGKLAISTKNGILSTVDSIGDMWGGTDLTLPLRAMIDNKIQADRLIMISDNEINGWRSYSCTCQRFADKYRREFNKDLWVHAIDLQGYGTQQFIGGKTNVIAGWSEKVLEFISLAEKGMETQVKLIENYE